MRLTPLRVHVLQAATRAACHSAGLKRAPDLTDLVKLRIAIRQASAARQVLLGSGRWYEGAIQVHE